MNLRLNILNGGNVRSYRVDGSKLNALLDLKPRRSIRTAVRKMWDELEKGIDFNDDIYYNIRWFESLYSKKLYKSLIS